MPAGPPPLQDPSSAVEVKVGQEHFRNGEVTLVVEGSGATRVVQLRSGDAAAHEAWLSHAGRFEDARLDRLLQRRQELTEEITDGALPYGDQS